MDIKEIVNSIDTGILVNTNDENDFYNLPIELEDMTWEHGADKIVIIDKDNVVKVPIKGEYVFIDELDYLEDSEVEDIIQDNFEYEGDGTYIRWFKDNSCKRELSIYNAAKKEGLDSFFAAEEEYTNQTVIQEKVHSDSEADIISKYAIDSIEKEPIITKLQKMSDYFFYSETIAILLSQHSYNEVKRFIKFCNKYKVNDLDFYNWGVNKNGMYVAFDYCGFHNDKS